MASSNASPPRVGTSTGGPGNTIDLSPFLPRLVLADPGRRVFPCQGTVVHVRLTGLHRLADVLARGGAGGGEEFERFSSACLESLTRRTWEWGGDILELETSELVAFFPDSPDLKTSVERALACAVDMRVVVERLGQSSSDDGPFSLHASFGVATGVIHGLLLGEVSLGQRGVFIGPALTGAVRASFTAGPNQICVQPSAGALIDPELVRTSPALPTPAMTRLEAFTRSVPLPPPPAELEPPSAETLRRFFAPSLLASLERGELRSRYHKVSVLTVAVTGVDPGSAAGFESLISWYERVQQLVSSFEGQILSIEVGLSTRLDVFFGAPTARNDDESRALQCAIGLQRAARDLKAVSDQRAGVATGTCFLALMGGRRRRQYAAAGARIELSRRLAGQAGPWEVLVDRYTVSRAGFGFDWGPPPSVPAGSDVELLTSRLLYGEGAYGTKLTSRSRGALVGREGLMAQLQELAAEAMGGTGRVVTLVGEAGIGKSALLVWLGQFLQSSGRMPVYRGECSSLIRQAPFHAWTPVFKEWLDLQVELPTEDLHARIEQRVASLGEDLHPRWPLLGMVIGINLPDNPTTQGLDVTQRRDALFALVLELFRRAHEQIPLGLIFEDAHWMDEASIALLRYLARNIGHLPVFITVTRRPVEGTQAEALSGLEALPGTVTLGIGELPLEALNALACRHLGAERLSGELEQLLASRSGGRPLFLEELTLLLRDTEQVQIDREGIAHLQADGNQGLPYDLRDVILNRVARLDEGAQLTLKAASAIGRNFSLSLLQEIYPVPFDLAVLMARLERVEGLDIVRRDEAVEAAGGSAGMLSGAATAVTQDVYNDSIFFFKHALIRDTIYETLTSAARRNLHEAIGLALERRLTPENRAELVLVLAEHFRRTLRTDKQRAYFREAGEILKARALNREAFTYLHAAEQLSHLVGDREAVSDLLEAEVAVLNALGDRDAQREAIARWKEVARELNDERRLADALRAEGNLLSRSGEPLKALKTLERARHIAQERHDALQEARVLRVICRTYYNRGELARALEAAEEARTLTMSVGAWREVMFDETNVGTILSRMSHVVAGREMLDSALRRAQEHDERLIAGVALSTLAVLDFQTGYYDRAMRLFEQALEMKRQVGERAEEGVTLNNMGFVLLSTGRYEEAHARCIQALVIARQIEDRWAEANTLINLGLAFAGRGQFADARERFQEAVEIAQQCGSKYAEAEALEGLAKIELVTGGLDEASNIVVRALSVGLHRKVPLTALSAILKARRGLIAEAAEEARIVEVELGAIQNAVEAAYLVRYYLALAFEASDPEKARRYLAESREELMSRASRVEDPTLRRHMLEDVPEHRAILEAWESMERRGEGSA